MHFLIIGAGWYGCHLALKLLDSGHTVKIVDKTNRIFQGSSSKNQNRLHIGFHYPRSSDTIVECIKGYYKFGELYKDCLVKFNMNYYLISKIGSYINVNEYCNIYTQHDLSYNIVSGSMPLEIINIETPIIQVEEQYINHKIACAYFENRLNSYICNIPNRDICNTVQGIIDYTSDSHNRYDYIINCTFNHLEPIEYECYELFLTLLYKIDAPQIFSYTLMDGPFFSIYPYDIDNHIYTVTSVVHGVLYRGNTPNFNYTTELITSRKQLIEQQIKGYIPIWSDKAIYIDYFTSWKTKHNTTTDDRSLRYSVNDNIITLYGGKITGIFEAERILFELLKDK